MHHSQLPNEIWLEVFQWATLPNQCAALHYIPFQALSEANDEHDRAVIGIRRNLSLVCRQWRQMSIELLYRDIRIAHGAKGLRDALRTKRAYGDLIYGDCVQRVVLPFSSTITGLFDASACTTSVDILVLCSKLQVLVRPPHLPHYDIHFHSEAPDVSLPSLKRLEWWHNNEAERTGGINSLTAVLCTAPDLAYLFVAGRAGRGMKLTPRHLSLPNLTTLRLYVPDGLLLYYIVHRWTLPALTHLILDVPSSSSQGFLMIWDKFGSQLRTVELGRHLRFLLEDAISPCLRGCPSLEEINYYAQFTASPELRQPHYSLKTVRLHYAANQYLVMLGSAWSSLELHFAALLGQQLPLLQRIVLHGDWGEVVAHPRFQPILERSVRQGRFIVYPDGSRVSNE